MGCLVPSYGPEEWGRQDRLLKHDGVVCALGIHPWRVVGGDSELLNQLDHGFASHGTRWGEKLVAVGEFGLDRCRPEFKNCFDDQVALFKRHLEWANKLSLPVILHVVKAHGKALELLKFNPPVAGGVIHSFAGPMELIGDYANLGFYFSYSGNLAHSDKARQALKATPPDRLLFETDGPDGPKPEACDVLGPAELPKILALASKILDKSKEWCSTLHRENGARLFPRAVTNFGLGEKT